MIVVSDWDEWKEEHCLRVLEEAQPFIVESYWICVGQGRDRNGPFLSAEQWITSDWKSAYDLSLISLRERGFESVFLVTMEEGEILLYTAASRNEGNGYLVTTRERRKPRYRLAASELPPRMRTSDTSAAKPVWEPRSRLSALVSGS